LPDDKDQSSDDTTPHVEGFRRPVAYREEAFLHSPESRPLRILSEYLWPLAHFQEEKIQDTIVFFGSARIEEDGPLGRYYREARELARLLTEWAASVSDSRRRFVICSGGGPGIMQAANQGASEAGGRSIGLNIGLPHEQRPNPYITPELSFQFHYFFMRKFWFVYLAKAVVLFPGGYGTLDELFTVLTLIQTGKTDRDVPVILMGTDYWTPLAEWMKDTLLSRKLIAPDDIAIWHSTDDIDEALQLIRNAGERVESGG